MFVERVERRRVGPRVGRVAVVVGGWIQLLIARAAAGIKQINMFNNKILIIFYYIVAGF